MHPLRRLRHEKPMSISELAAASGIGTTTILRIENGPVERPQSSTIRALAEALGCEPADLMEPHD